MGLFAGTHLNCHIQSQGSLSKYSKRAVLGLSLRSSVGIVPRKALRKAPCT